MNAKRTFLALLLGLCVPASAQLTAQDAAQKIRWQDAGKHIGQDCIAYGTVVRVKTRSQKGAIQLHRAFPELTRNDPRDYRTALLEILRKPEQWANCFVYLYVILVTRLRAYWLNLTRNLGEWERDETSRSTTR